MKRQLVLINDDQDHGEWINQLLINRSDPLEWVLIQKTLDQIFNSETVTDFDVVLLSLPENLSCQSPTLQQLKKVASYLPVIVMGETTDQAIAQQLLNLGVQDYLVISELTSSLLVQSLRYAKERYQRLKYQRESERRFRAIFDQTFEAMWLLTPEGCIVESNQTALQLMGTKAEDIVNLPLWQALQKHLFPADQETLKQAIATVVGGELVRYELDVQTPSGTLITLDFSLKPIYNQDQYVDLLLVECWDISQRKWAELETIKSLEKARQLSELRAKFVTTVSHEFRTPMSTILLSSELLEKYSHKWTEEKKQTHTQRIKIAIKRMTELLEDVLLTGQAEAGQLEFKPTLVKVHEVCAKILDKFQNQEGFEHHLVFVNENSSLEAEIDLDMLQVILNQLLVNAIKYSPKGAMIKVKLTQDTQQIILRVEDQGIGIPIEEQYKIFDRFYRGSNVGNISGTGLGLTLVKRFVEAHQGKICLESYLGSGSQFSVHIPVISKE